MKYLLADDDGRVVVQYNPEGSTYLNMSPEKKARLFAAETLPAIDLTATPEGMQPYYKIENDAVVIAYEPRPVSPEEEKIDNLTYEMSDLFYQDGPLVK